MPRKRRLVRRKTTTGIINDSHPTIAQRKKVILHCKHVARHAFPLLGAAILFAVQLSPLEIAVFALVMDICHGGDARYRALPPTKKRRGGIIDDARAQRPIKYSRRRHLLMCIIFVRTRPRDASRRVIRIERARVRQVIPLHSPHPRCDFVNISARKYWNATLRVCVCERARAHVCVSLSLVSIPGMTCRVDFWIEHRERFVILSLRESTATPSSLHLIFCHY